MMNPVPAIYSNYSPEGMRARDFEMELSGIRSVDEVVIDHNVVLAIKRGDLAII